ncbi:MAG: rod shape-determining protein MreD [Oscillochloridaceae bacterium umkhey_bin13]
MGDTQSRRLEERLAGELLRLVAIALLALVQVTLLRTPLGFTVPLVLVLVISRALLGVAAAFPDREVTRSLRWALYGGLSLDLLANTALGSHALALLVPTLLVLGLTLRLRTAGPLLLLLATALATLIYELILALLNQPLPSAWNQYLLVVIVPSILLALLPALPIFFGLRWLLRERG